MDLTKVEEQLKKVPEEIKRAFFSVETAQKINDIGNNNDLHIDQIDTLIEETGYAMIGLKPATKFVETISKELEIDGELAKKIANEINTEVLSAIKSSARIAQESKEEATNNENAATKNAEIEKAGGFTIEKDEARDGGTSGDTNGIGSGNQAETTVSYKDKEQILSDIENPTPSKESKVNRETAEMIEGPHTEPLVDYLLSSPTGSKTETVSTTVPTPQSPQKTPPISIPEPPPKPKSPDLYREPVK